MDKRTADIALYELNAAQQIIRNALAIMTLDQKIEWAQRNEADGCIGEGTTRAHERLSAIQCLTEGLSHG